MKIKCDYCGNTYEEFQPNCPSCGAPNPSHHDGDKQPRTIEELKKWYEDRHLPPPEVTRFFIGIDYKEPKAFGIYKDENGEFIVYKNKADGTRAVRYKGKDEAYAVDELYQKLKDEIVHQKARTRSAVKSPSPTTSGSRPYVSRSYVTTNHKSDLSLGAIFRTFILINIILTLGTSFLVSVGRGPSHAGYYQYDDTYYYYDDDDWYSYSDDWYITTPPVQYDASNTDPYYLGRDYDDIEWEFTNQDFILSGGGNLKSFTDVTDSTSYKMRRRTPTLAWGM